MKENLSALCARAPELEELSKRLVSSSSRPNLQPLFALIEPTSKTSSASVARRLTDITKTHRVASVNDFTASSRHFVLMKGVRRKIGSAQQGKAPLFTADILRSSALPSALSGLRDSALVLAGFAAPSAVQSWR